MPQDNVSDQQIRFNQYLPFEVVAISQNDTAQLENKTEYCSTEPLNIKIRIRNKEQVGNKHGIISIPKLSANSGKKVRLVNSDQTIMSFDYFMDPNISNKNEKKSHKNIFHIFRPGSCLRTQKDNDNNDEYSYSPSSFSDVNKIKNAPSLEENNISKTIIIRKNIPPITPTDKATKTTGKFMGKCKRGGCLDPPFTEDKYSYEPNKISDVSLNFKTVGEKVSLNREANANPLYYENIANNNIQKASENITRIQLKSNISQETCSHSLITYPTGCSENNFQTHKHSRDVQFKYRISSEDKARISKNELSEIFFMPPKKDKTEKVERKYSENAFHTVDTDLFDSNKKELSINHREIELPKLSINSTMPLSADADTAKLNLINCDGEKNREMETSNDHFKSQFESTEFIDDVEATAQKSDISYVDNNIILDRNSVVALLESNLNIDDIQTNEIDLKNNFTHSKDSSRKKTSNININELVLPPFENKNTENINAENTKYLAEDIATKTKEVYSTVVSQKSLNMSYEDIAHKGNVKTLKSKEIPTIHLNIDSHVVKESKETYSENFEVITDTDKIQDLPLENIDKQNTDLTVPNKTQNSTKESNKSLISENKVVPDLKKNILVSSITSEKIGENDPKNKSSVIIFETKLIEDIDKNDSFTYTKQQVIDTDEIKIPSLKVKDSKESITIKNEKVKLKPISSNSLSSQNVDTNDVYKELKESERSIEKSKEYFAKQIEKVVKTDEVKTIMRKIIGVDDIDGVDVNKNKFHSVLQATESTYSSIKHRKPSKEKLLDSVEIDKIKQSFVSNIETENQEINTNINNTFYNDNNKGSTRTLIKSEEKDRIEKSVERDYALLDIHQASFNNQKSITNIDKDKDEYIAHLKLDIDDMNNGQITSNNSNKSFTRTTPSTSLIRDTVDEISHKSFDELKTTTTSGSEIDVKVSKIGKKDSSTIYTEPIHDKTIDSNEDILPRISKENEHTEVKDQGVINEKLSSDRDFTMKSEFYGLDNFNAKNTSSEPSINTGDKISHKSFDELKTNSTSGSEIDVEVSKIGKKDSSTIYTEPIHDKTIDANEDILPRISKENEHTEVKDQGVINEKISSDRDFTMQSEFYGLDNFNAKSISSKLSIKKVDVKTDIDYAVQASQENNAVSSRSLVEIDFGFRCSVNNENKIVIQTIDSAKSSQEGVHGDVIIKTIIRMDDDEIRIPVNFNTDLIMQMKKVELTNKDGSWKKQGAFENDFNKMSTDRTVNKDMLLKESLNSVYENLIPLNKLIQNLKEEANTLTRQQNSLKEILHSMKMKPKRLINTYPQCDCEK